MGPIPRPWARLAGIPWSLGIAAGFIAFFAFHPEWHGDLQVFREAPESLRHPYYARWLFALLGALPEPAAYVLLSTLCAGLLYLAVRSFGGRHWMVFLSFPYAWTLFYGQIDGIVMGGLALAWWASRRQKAWLVGLGLVLACIKPQMGLPLGLLIWWWTRPRWQALVIPALVVAVSLAQYGFWIPAWYRGLFHTDDLVLLSRNISLWTLTGPWIWLVWPLAAWLPLERRRKLLAFAAATMMSVPYFPLSSTVLFLVMPAPAWSWAAVELPILAGAFGWHWIYDAMKAVPPALLIWAAWPAASKYLARLRRVTPPP